MYCSSEVQPESSPLIPNGFMSGTAMGALIGTKAASQIGSRELYRHSIRLFECRSRVSESLCRTGREMKTLEHWKSRFAAITGLTLAESL